MESLKDGMTLRCINEEAVWYTVPISSECATSIVYLPEEKYKDT
jgi:hypothetical protein